MAPNNLLKIINETTENFHLANPDFDILKSNLHDQEELKAINWDGLDKESTIEQLKAHQRVLRVHPDVNTAQFLLANGLDSAHKIADIPQQHFVQMFINSNSINSDNDMAIDIYNNAVQVKTRAKHLLANVRDIVGSSFSRATQFNNASPELTEYFENLPGYQELFGSLDYFRCNPSYTIFSPAAYFLDLMRLTDQYITYPNTIKPQGNVPQGFTLQERRPDLFEMKLDSDNTNTMISYLKIINGILERRIENEYVLNFGTAQAGSVSSITLASNASTDNAAYNMLSIEITDGTGIGQKRKISSYNGVSKIAQVDYAWAIQPDNTSQYRILDSAFKILSVAGYPFNLPFNLPLQQLRLYLEKLNVSLSQIYLDFLAANTSGTVQSATVASVTLAPYSLPDNDAYKGMQLELSGGKGKGQSRTVTAYDGVSKIASLSADWDIIPDNTSIYRIADIRNYARECLKLSIEESNIITTPNKSADSLNQYYGYDNIAKKLPFQGAGKITFTNGLKNVHGSGVDFTTGLSLGDQLQCGDKIRTVVKIVSSQELLVEVAWDSDASNQDYTILPGEGLDHVSIFLYRTGLTRKQMDDLFTQDLNQDEMNKGKADKFFINNTDEQNKPVYLHTIFDKTDPGNHCERIVGLSFSRLDRINRFIRLKAVLDWSYADLDWALVSLGASEIDRTALENIAGIKLLRDTMQLPVDVLCSFWFDMKTIGRKSIDYQDLFDRVFNNPVLLDGKNPYDTNISPIPFDPSRPLNWNIDDRTGQNAIIRSRLTGALLVSDNDLTIVAQYLLALIGNKGQPLELNLINMTWLYRLTKLPVVLGLNIDEFITMQCLLYYPDRNYLDPPVAILKADLRHILSLHAWIEWLNKSPFNVYELQYILTARQSDFFTLGYKTEDVKSFIQNLAVMSQGSCLSSDQFMYEDIDAMEALTVFNQLKAHQFITDRGVFLKEIPYDALFSIKTVTPASFISGDINMDDAKKVFSDLQSHKIIDDTGNISESFNKDTDLSFLFPEDRQAEQKQNEVRSILLQVKYCVLIINKTSFQTNDISEQDSVDVFNKLIQNGICDTSGVLSPSFDGDTSLDFLFMGDEKAVYKRSEVRTILLQLKRDIEHTLEILSKTEKLQETSVINGLAVFLGTNTEILPVIMPHVTTIKTLDYLKDFLTPLGVSDLVPDNVMKLIIALSQWIMLVNKLSITTYETKAVMNMPKHFNLESITCLTLTNIKSLTTFKQLVCDFQDTDGALIQYFDIPKDKTLPGPKIDAISKITGWESSQIVSLINNFWPSDGVDSQNDYDTVEGIKRLERCFNISDLTGCDIYFLQKLYALNTLPLTDSSGSVLNSNWVVYNNLAQATLGAVNSKYRDDDFSAICKSVTNELDTIKRDALLGFSIWILGKKFKFIEKPSDLYQYLLIDTEMSSCASTSRIAQGIASVQLYMQRCRMNLEEGITEIQIPVVWWEWVSNYRIWEVNRKIFLYPENYIEPTLRKDQTPIFKELAEGLLQSNITDDTVSAVFNNYFDKFMAVAKLIYCAGYNCRVTNLKTNEEVETLFVFARTNTEPYTYYYRSFAKTASWSAWQKIDLTINSPYISPVFAYNRLFIFWVELNANKSSNISNGVSKSQTVNEASIKYSFVNASGQWVQPQVLAEADAIGVYPDEYNPLKNEYIQTLFDLEQLHWQQPYVLKVERGIPGSGKITFIKDLANAHGTNSQFKRQLNVGDSIMCSCETRNVIRIISDQDILVDKPWNVEVTNANYKIIPKNKDTVSFQPFKGMGLITIGEGIQNVQGYNSQFENQINVGDRIQCAGDTRTVIKVKPGQQLLVDTAWNTSAQNAEYTVMPRFNGSERLFVFYGSALDIARATTPDTLNPDPNPGKDSFIENKNNFNLRLFESLALANNAKTAKIAGDVVSGQSYQLDSNLIQEECRVLMVDYDNITGSPKPYRPAIERNNCILKVIESTNLLVDNYWGNSSSFSTTSSGGNLNLLANISEPNSSIANVSNQPGWFIFNNGDESFLVTSMEVGLGKISDVVLVYPYPSPAWTNGQNVVCGSYTDNLLAFSDLKFSFTRLSTNTVGALSRRLLAGGTDSLLSLEAQQTPELPFNRFYQNSSIPPACVVPPVTDKLDFNGSYGLYFWEIFFHAPFLIASSLNVNQRFEEAKRWYQYIFNPTQKLDAADAHSNDRFWRFLPFRDLTLQSIEEIFKNQDQIDAYNNDPFDPDAIARLRPGAYPKAVVMRYIDNLLDYGDYLFAQDTREAINQAANLYVMASDLLGKRPEAVGDFPLPEAKNFNEIKKQYHGKIPEFIIELENSPVMLQNTCDVALNDVPFNDINSYFGIPENDEFIQYWDRVEDRLYKIRHCMNIQGVERQLALFEPPIDPRQLIRAAASGQGDMSIANQLQPHIPYFRFMYILEKAKGLASNLIQLGSSFLSALEKSDAEQLSTLRNVQEKALLNLNTMIKQKQIDETASQGVALQESLNSAKTRNDYYVKLVQNGLSQGEIANIQAMEAALVFNVLAGITKTASSIGYAVPNTGSPFAMTYGGREIGAMLNAASGVFEIGSMISSYIAQRSLTMAGYERRLQEWQFQTTMSGIDINQVGAQINANQIHRKIVERELEVHKKSIQQNEEMEQYFTGKFTNRELYQWMISRLSTVYFQTYAMAFDLARSAQRAYQYELDSDQTFVNFGYWDNLHKGLTAGEGLMLALSQMEKAYLDNNSRYLEIEKSISLLQLNPKALLDLKTKGECIFELSEKLFDYDFPGHYCRKIKTIAISIPAVVGPYQNIKATLTQLSNQIIIKPNVGAVDFLLGGKNASAPASDVLRSNWWINQQIAISRGVNDSGMFELNFRDEQYLPFEGTGAVSSWRLSMPLPTNRINFNDLSDVIIVLKYTAVNGGSNFRDQVTRLESLKPFSGGRVVSLCQEYPQQWYSFLNNHSGTDSQVMSFQLSGLVPPHINNAVLVGFYFKLDLVPATNATSRNNYIKFQLTDSVSVDFNLDTSCSYTHSFQTSKPNLSDVDGNRKVIFDLHKDYTPETLKKNGFLNPDIIKNITVILYYQGDVNWS